MRLDPRAITQVNLRTGLVFITVVLVPFFVK
jgi:hypothetical protein